jgi:hypothetical protein
MSFSYSAGTATPGYGGLVDFPSLRINQGTYKPLAIPPLTQTPPPRFVTTPVPRGGGNVSTVSLDAWAFNIDGYFDVVDPADVQAAIDYLKSKINTFKGAIGITLNAGGWTDTRTMTVYVGGQVTFEEPQINLKKAPRRNFSIPLIAADPLQYGSTQVVTSVTTSTSVPNAGDASIPYIVHFDGPVTTYIEVNDGLGNKVRLDYAIPLGKMAEISTRDGSIVTDTGVDLYQYLTISSSMRYLPAGGKTMNTANGGAGTASVKAYPGWI